MVHRSSAAVAPLSTSVLTVVAQAASRQVLPSADKAVIISAEVVPETEASAAEVPEVEVSTAPVAAAEAVEAVEVVHTDIHVKNHTK